MSCEITKTLFTRHRVAQWPIAVMLALAVLAMLPSSAKAWWNDDWSLRKKITIDASATGANITDPIGTTPVLVRLHTGNFRFSSAKDDGSDLRFILSDDKTPLKYHIERYDSLLNEALVWVAVPNLLPGAKAEIWLYFGNKKALPTSDPKGTYDPDTLLDYHFAERGTPAIDSSVWANNAQSVVQPADGALIGPGLRLDGTNPLTLPASPSLALADSTPFTWTAWIRPAALAPSAAIYSRRDGSNGFVIGLDNGVPYVEITRAGAVQRSNGSTPISTNTWHQLAVVATATDTSIYVDGDPYAVLSAALPALTTISLVGGDTAVAAPAPAAPTDSGANATPAPDANGAAGANTPAGANAPAGTGAPAGDAAATPAPAPVAAPVAAAGFVGDLDELQISKVARPLGYIKFAAIDQGTDPSKLIVYSIDEETSSWLSGYFAVILKSVTADGWVVIGILLIMAVMSWVVMLNKASYLGKQAKANDKFMKRFREITGDLTAIGASGQDQIATITQRLAADNAKSLQASSLYRLYLIGAEEIRRRFAGRGGDHILTASAIAAIRASLDGGFVKESQGLNRTMVILTIAISGGPFLGLLGTVVGVMITFAAIAASGDVNVNAIAPGIAAALVATVAGLGVAIPALFGYNYLISRIRDLGSDMQIFVDEFVTRMAEVYASDRPDPMPRMAAE